MKIKEKIEFLYCAADIFSYPDSEWIQKLELIGKLAGEKLECDKSLEDIQAIYINFFELNSSKFNVVPIASYWIEGRLNGDTSDEIEKFYEMCGLKFNDFGMCDHVSKMFAFSAWLLENGKILEFEAFKEWFFWLEKFCSSVEKVSELRPFYQVLIICSKLLKKR